MASNWKYFEIAVYEILKQLSTDAKLQYNYKVKGVNTERLRQIDVAIFDTISGIDLFIAVECKDYSKPVDVKEIEAFIMKLDDISADKGIMVSSNGFTQSARNYANKKRLQLFTLSSEDVDFDLYIDRPVLVKEMTHYSFSVSYIPPDLINDSTFDIEKMCLYTDKDEYIPDINDFIMQQWNSGILPADVGHNMVTIDKVKIKHLMKQYKVELGIYFTVSSKLYIKKFKLIQLQDYHDVLKDELVTQRGLTEEFFNENQVINDSYRKISLSELDNDKLDKLIEARLKFNLDSYE